MSRNYKGFTFTVEQMPADEILNPRESAGLYGTLALFHKRLRLGDTDPKDAEGATVTLSRAEAIEADTAHYLTLPVYGYDHGLMRVSTNRFSDTFDSGKLGIIFVPRSKMIPALKEEDYKELMREEVEAYDRYLSNEVYRYDIPLGTVANVRGDHFGSEHEAIQAAMEAIDELIEDGTKQDLEDHVHVISPSKDGDEEPEEPELEEPHEEPAEEPTERRTIEIDGCFID